MISKLAFLSQLIKTQRASKGAVTLWNVSCNLSRNVFATLWRDKLHETFRSVTYPATAKIVARQVARAVAENRMKFYCSCNLSRNDFGRCWVCYTVKCFVQLVPPPCRQNIARQVARNISQCNSALHRKLYDNIFKKRNRWFSPDVAAAMLMHRTIEKKPFGNLTLW